VLPQGWLDQIKDLKTLEDERDCLEGMVVDLEKKERAEEAEADRRMEELGYDVPKTKEEEEAFLAKRDGILKQVKRDTKKPSTSQKKKKTTLGEEDAEEMLRKCSSRAFKELAEAPLCFHAWYKLGVNKVTADGKINTGIIRASVARMLSMVRWYTPRKKGNVLEDVIMGTSVLLDRPGSRVSRTR
jgi:hypothetical protein